MLILCDHDSSRCLKNTFLFIIPGIYNNYLVNGFIVECRFQYFDFSGNSIVLDDEHDVKWREARMERVTEIATFEAEVWVFRLTVGVLKYSYYKNQNPFVICIIWKNIAIHDIMM